MAGPAGAAEKASQRLGELGPIELSGKLVMTAEIEQPFLPLAAVVDCSERALRHAGASVRIDAADSGVLDPQRGALAAAFGEKTIVQAVAQLGGATCAPPVIPS